MSDYVPSADDIKSVSDLANSYVKGDAGAIVNDAGKGALTGVAIGTALGTVFPGVGNAVGAAIGAIVGALAGLFSGLAAKKAAEQQAVTDEVNKAASAIRAALMAAPSEIRAMVCNTICGAMKPYPGGAYNQGGFTFPITVKLDNGDVVGCAVVTNINGVRAAINALNDIVKNAILKYSAEQQKKAAKKRNTEYAIGGVALAAALFGAYELWKRNKR